MSDTKGLPASIAQPMTRTLRLICVVPALSPLCCLSAQVEIIKGLPDDAIISLYRCGPMVDLCHGPHLPNTGYIKACAVHNVSRAFWRADVTQEPLMVRPGAGSLLAAEHIQHCTSIANSLGCPCIRQQTRPRCLVAVTYLRCAMNLRCATKG